MSEPTNTGGWVVFGLRPCSTELQADYVGNLDAPPLLPSGSTGSPYVCRDLDRDFPNY